MLVTAGQVQCFESQGGAQQPDDPLVQQLDNRGQIPEREREAVLPTGITGS